VDAADGGRAAAWARAALGDQRLTASVVWSGNGATTYRLDRGGSVVAYLKTGAGDLAGERDRLVWLGERIAAAQVLGFTAEAGEAWLLTAPLHGADLSRPEHTPEPHRLVHLLAAALHQLHSLPPEECPFSGHGGGDAVVHGDACLPNVVFDGTAFAGFLDVGELGVGAREIDLAAAVWSLDHNLGPGFGGEFLRRYGWADDEATVERLRLSYEQM
jgi:aminoglycoside phosphotransferase